MTRTTQAYIAAILAAGFFLTGVSLLLPTKADSHTVTSCKF